MTLDPEPVLVAQAVLAEFSAGTALEGVAVRVGRLEDEDVPPVLLLEVAGELHNRSVPMFLPARVSVKAYGVTDDDALLLYRAASNIFHRRRRTELGDGIVLAGSFDETGPQALDDPSTTWPVKYGVMDLYMPDVAINLGS